MLTLDLARIFLEYCILSIFFPSLSFLGPPDLAVCFWGRSGQKGMAIGLASLITFNIKCQYSVCFPWEPSKVATVRNWCHRI